MRFACSLARRASVAVRNTDFGAADANGNQPVFVSDLPQQLRVSHGDATLATGTRIWFVYTLHC